MRGETYPIETTGNGAATLFDLADYDGDGLLDFAVIGDMRGHTWRGAGDGTFTPWHVFEAPFSPVALSSADLDGDGDADLVITVDGDPGQIWVIANDTLP